MNLYIVWIVCFTLSHILRSVIGLTGNCATRNDTPCRIHRYHGWQCISRIFESDFPELYQESLQCRSPKLNVSVLQKEIDGKLEQGIQLLWSPYTQVGMRFVKGFEIAVLGLDGNAIGMHLCFVADLSRRQLNDTSFTDKKHIIFRHVIWSVPSESTYVIRVTSLPGIDQDNVDTGSTIQVHLVSPEVKNYLPPAADWQTSVNCTINSSFVLIEFNLPPTSYGFMHVKVDLLLKKKEMVMVRSNITSTLLSDGDYGHENPILVADKLNDALYDVMVIYLPLKQDAVQFDSVSPGEYMAWVQPWDLYPFDPEKCLCKNFEGLCDACRISTDQLCVVELLSMSTSTLTTSIRNAMTPSAQTLESTDVEKIVVISIKATLLIVIVAIIISVTMCLRIRYANTHKNDNNTGTNDKNKPSEEQNITMANSDSSQQVCETLYCSAVIGGVPSGTKLQFGDIRYDFIGPDSDSALYDRTSKSISEQMLKINERYFTDNCSTDVFNESSSLISLGGQSV